VIEERPPTAAQHSSLATSECELIIGADVGSTTVKTVAIDPQTQRIVWSTYQRHETRQAAMLETQLSQLQNEFAHVDPSGMRIFLTGSGAPNLVSSVGGKFIQEVNAVTLAVEVLHPDVGSVIELGGQDAKIIIYKEIGTTGNRRVIASMNDKCASGTGATIDKCVTKVGLGPDVVAALEWDSSKLHHVAAKCGVFAETDIVNLIKSGIPSTEVLCSLANAIVMQNLAVLTRGNTLRHRVLLLGGPNTYLKFLQGCWRQRISEVWNERHYGYPRAEPLDRLVFVPPRSELYAAYGAALFGMQQPAEVGRYIGVERLRDSMKDGGAPRRSSAVGPPLMSGGAERDTFVAKYRIPPFLSVALFPGQHLKGFIGIDGGSTSSKAVLLGEDGAVLCKQYQLSRGNPIADTKDILEKLQDFASAQGAELEVLGVGATGYAADILEQTLSTDANVVETVAHMQAATRYFSDVDVICDVGGQDIKVLFMEQGRIRNFRLSNQCSAGNGMLLQAMANQFGIRVDQYAELAFQAELSPIFNYGCAVFLDTDRVTFQKEGFSREELLAGLALVLPKNIWQYVVQIPRLAQLGKVFVLQGGTQYNLAAVKAQHDYITQRVPGAIVHVHPHCGEAGAIGAALEAQRVVQRRGKSTFIGLRAAIGITFTSTNDESTVCHFCPNECKRTFIDTITPTGGASRYIAGFSCENGTVESKEDLKKIAQHRKALRGQFPNLVQYEAELAFKSFFKPEPLASMCARAEPQAAVPTWPRRRARALHSAASTRSDEASRQRRQFLRVGMPRVLNMYSTGPLWRAYFETLGLASRNIVFSEFTSAEMWEAGGRYGSIDPCFPAKVTQAHIHELLFKKHLESPLDFIFFPCITRLPSFVTGMPDSTACPVVAGAPKVARAAFTKEIDYFAKAAVDYVDAAFALTEPNLFKQQMFEAWGERLGVTEEESDFAAEQGLAALQRFDQEMQHRGLLALETLERDKRVGILLLARPYHADPGLNHELLEEFQALGYPVLSIRSIPKDRAWLRRFFPELNPTVSPLAISDVWPEAYSTNSAEKVWAAKFAARHPNLVVLDLSSFKCGNDAPTYGMIDNIIASGNTPYSALHDIDANKPGGSIKIRVRTYEYTLRRHAEGLQSLADKRSELERLVENKRRELYAHRRQALEASRFDDPRQRQLQESLEATYDEYLTHEPPSTHGRIAEPDRAACAPAPPPSAEIILPWPRWHTRPKAANQSREPEHEHVL
jgi:activator of 2-hydroxyglutaryl-CoA dehydratase/predicted nucleotide-binding protein (sugar kinase/HSP70/actin superfamily)